MNKEELQKQYNNAEKSLEAAKKKLEKLGKQIEGSKGDMFKTEAGDVIGTLYWTSGRFEVAVSQASRMEAMHREFTLEGAGHWQEAFNVILELRACEGVVEAVALEHQYMIGADQYGERTYIDTVDNLNIKLGKCFSPVFGRQKNATAAIDKVGEDRILQAMKTLAGVKT